MSLTKLSFAELFKLLGDSLNQVCSDLTWAEVVAFHSGLRSTFGLKAMGEDGSPPYCAVLYSRNGKVRIDDRVLHYNAPVVPRDELLKALEACSGLGRDTCGEGLEALERKLDELSGGSRAIEVRVEALGRFTRVSGGVFLVVLDQR